MDMTLVTGLVALFTASLVIVGYLQVRAMKRYTEVTTRLLEQSEKAFKQSQVAFESDLVSKIMFYGAELRAKEVVSKRFAEGFVNGMIAVIHKVDRSLYKKVIDDIGAFSEARGAESFAWATEQAKKKSTEMKNEVNND